MTEGYSSSYPAGSTATGNEQSTADVAKSQASDVKDSAVEAGGRVASVAKDQASNVAAEAGSQAKDLLGQARSELTQQAATQHQRVAEGLKSLGQELRSMSDNSQTQGGMATGLASQGADFSERASNWLSDREPGDLLNEARRFAGQRPGAFLLLAAGAGLLAGRLTRGLKDDASSDDSTASSGQHRVSPSHGEYSAGSNSTRIPGYVGNAQSSGGDYYAGSVESASIDNDVQPYAEPGALPVAGSDGELGYPTGGGTR